MRAHQPQPAAQAEAAKQQRSAARAQPAPPSDYLRLVMRTAAPVAAQPRDDAAGAPRIVQRKVDDASEHGASSSASAEASSAVAVAATDPGEAAQAKAEVESAREQEKDDEETEEADEEAEDGPHDEPPMASAEGAEANAQAATGGESPADTGLASSIAEGGSEDAQMGPPEEFGGAGHVAGRLLVPIQQKQGKLSAQLGKIMLREQIARSALEDPKLSGAKRRKLQRSLTSLGRKKRALAKDLDKANNAAHRLRKTLHNPRFQKFAAKHAGMRDQMAGVTPAPAAARAQSPAAKMRALATKWLAGLTDEQREEIQHLDPELMALVDQLFAEPVDRPVPQVKKKGKWVRAKGDEVAGARWVIDKRSVADLAGRDPRSPVFPTRDLGKLSHGATRTVAVSAAQFFEQLASEVGGRALTYVGHSHGAFSLDIHVTSSFHHVKWVNARVGGVVKRMDAELFQKPTAEHKSSVEEVVSVELDNGDVRATPNGRGWGTLMRKPGSRLRFFDADATVKFFAALHRLASTGVRVGDAPARRFAWLAIYNDPWVMNVVNAAYGRHVVSGPDHGPDNLHVHLDLWPLELQPEDVAEELRFLLKEK